MNVMRTQSKAPLTTLGLAVASSLGAIAFSTPAYSINVDLSTFDAIGDVTNNNTVIQLFNQEQIIPLTWMPWRPFWVLLRVPWMWTLPSVQRLNKP